MSKKKSSKSAFDLGFFNKSSLPKLSPLERQNSTVLVVEPDINIKNSLRMHISSLGFSAVSETNDRILALQKLEQRKFTHVLFDAKNTNMSGREFLTKVFEYDEDIVAIPTSFEPTVDDVFDLLVIGAKGYLVKPFTEESVDIALVMATKGEPLSDAILYAKDRNEALVSLIMTALDKLATIMRQAQQFETARRELPKAQFGLKRAIDIGHTFAKGGDDKLLEEIIEFCVDRSQGPASKLGRTRKRLSFKKKTNEEQSAEETQHTQEVGDEHRESSCESLAKQSLDQ
jgi:two-component system, chemotaxis family, chemotaxis protein CheY